MAESSDSKSRSPYAFATINRAIAYPETLIERIPRLQFDASPQFSDWSSRAKNYGHNASLSDLYACAQQRIGAARNLLELG